MCQAVLRWLQGAVASAECEEIAFAADVGRRNGSDGEVAGSYGPRGGAGGAAGCLSVRRCGGRIANCDPVLGRGQAGMGAPLTAREMEVLCYLVLGWDNANIAAELGGSAQGLCRAITTLVSAPMFGSGLRSFQQVARGYLNPLWSRIQRPWRIVCLIAIQIARGALAYP